MTLLIDEDPISFHRFLSTNPMKIKWMFLHCLHPFIHRTNATRRERSFAKQNIDRLKLKSFQFPMASSRIATLQPSSQDKPKELCRYFLSNVCRFGDQCLYSHDRSTGQANNVCRFYLQGKCNYGERCRYDHVRPKPVPPPAPPAQRIEPAMVQFSQLNVHSPPFPDPTSFSAPTPVTNGAPLSYANVCRLNNPVADFSVMIDASASFPSPQTFQALCPYAEKTGVCEALETGQYCPYVHGELCDLCQMPALHPFDEKQREQHRLECLQQHEAECEEAFAIQRSQDKKCGVCLETVWERDGDKRFGILENCDHIFCLECIRKWRASSSYDNRVVKACPECRVKSDFVTPTQYWPENDQSKRDLIRAYKENLQQIPCKFFRQGDGVCPFGSKCFYSHVDKSGRPVQLPPPRRRVRLNERGELENYSDVLMASIFANEDIGRYFDEYDFLFDDEDDESPSFFDTDDDDVHFHDEYNHSDNDGEGQSWH